MRIEELFEAKISGANIGSAMTKIIGYLERHMGFKLRKLGVETFHNSAEEGRGVRYLEDGTLNCIRFNWVGSNSSEIVSVDLWNGTSHDPNFNIEFKGVSLAQSLPALVKVLKAPKVGHVPVTKESLTEAKKGEFTPESAVADMIEKLESGRSFNRSEFIMAYHPENAFAYDEFVEKFADDLVLAGKRISLPKGEKIKGTKGSKGSKSSAEGELIVTKGGKGEEYESDEVQRLEKEDHVTFSESIEHLQGLTTALIKGSTNAIFVAGKGGTGKTQTIEDTLAAQGLTDGAGYYKITGSASPIGIYSMLYKYRKGIIVFDDCDGALESQDGRNIIKAATDTKKIRKLAWGKKSAGMFDPDSEPQREEPAEGEEELDDDRIPKHFNFEGRVIFISNLPLNKLDPDGALRTRAFIINIDPTAKEMIERMEEIVDDIKLEAGSLNHKERQEVLDVIKGSKRKEGASLRTLVRALNLAASGAPNWQRLVDLYA